MFYFAIEHGLNKRYYILYTKNVICLYNNNKNNNNKQKKKQPS